MTIPPYSLACLCGFAFLAGLVDAIAGGGGVIQVPALMMFLPGVPLATVFGTNKIAAIAGTSVAAAQYPRHVDIHWRVTLPAAIAAFICSYCGARLLTIINADAVLRPIVLVLLVAVAAYTLVAKEFGLRHAPRFGNKRQMLLGAATGGMIGLYDGFFGPGTGTFLMFSFVGMFGFSFLSATASAKIVNMSTNLAAIICFAWTDNIIYHIGIPMGICNILGSLVGTRLAVLKGSKFVRVVYLIVVALMLFKIGWDMWRRMAQA